MLEYGSNHTPNTPGEASQAQHLFSSMENTKLQFDSQSDVSVSKLPTLQTNPDGSVITRNADGLITTVFTPTGVVRHLAYDNHGTIIQFNDAQNYVYKLENACFQQYEPGGIDATGFSLTENEADIDYEGNLTVYSPDQSHTIAKTDGSVIEVDSACKISQVKYSNGSAIAIEYDAAGRLNSIVDLLTGNTLGSDAQTEVYIDALGVISIVQAGMACILKTDGECLPCLIEEEVETLNSAITFTDIRTRRLIEQLGLPARILNVQRLQCIVEGNSMIA